MIDLNDPRYKWMLKADGFDDCITGICKRCGQDDIIAYDTTKVIAKLVAQGMDEGEAWEYFEFNIVGAYMGEMTPCFISPVD